MNIDYPTWPGWKTIRKIGQGSIGSVYEIEREISCRKETAALRVFTFPMSGDYWELREYGYSDNELNDIYEKQIQAFASDFDRLYKGNDFLNVVRCDGMRYVQQEDGVGWVVLIKMELLTPLRKVLDRTPSESQVLQIARDICKGMRDYASVGMLHLNIKPNNIFVSRDGTYKIADLGLQNLVRNAAVGLLPLSVRMGLTKYNAPEVNTVSDYIQNYCITADIYSVGLVLYWMLNERRLPFEPLPPEMPRAAISEKAQMRRLSGEPLPAPKCGSPELKKIVLKACAFDPEERYQTAEEMLSALNNIPCGSDFDEIRETKNRLSEIINMLSAFSELIEDFFNSYSITIAGKPDAEYCYSSYRRIFEMWNNLVAALEKNDNIDQYGHISKSRMDDGKWLQKSIDQFLCFDGEINHAMKSLMEANEDGIEEWYQINKERHFAVIIELRTIKEHCLESLFCIEKKEHRIFVEWTAFNHKYSQSTLESTTLLENMKSTNASHGVHDKRTKKGFCGWCSSILNRIQKNSR